MIKMCKQKMYRNSSPSVGEVIAAKDNGTSNLNQTHNWKVVSLRSAVFISMDYTKVIVFQFGAYLDLSAHELRPAVLNKENAW